MTSRIVLAVALVALAACGADGASSAGDAPAPAASAPAASEPAASEPVVVTIARSRFSTPELRVPVGTTVVFENTDEFAHTVTSTADSAKVFSSDELGRGDTFVITFDEAGRFPYFCMIHPTMRATVVVE